jgi:hypothetical protein
MIGMGRFERVIAQIKEGKVLRFGCMSLVVGGDEKYENRMAQLLMALKEHRKLRHIDFAVRTSLSEANTPDLF